MNNKEIDEFLDQVGTVLEETPEDAPKDVVDQIFKSMIGGSGIRLLGEIAKRLPETPAPVAVQDEPAPAPVPYSAERKALQGPAENLYYRLRNLIKDVGVIDPAQPLGFVTKKSLSEALSDIQKDAEIIASILLALKDAE